MSKVMHALNELRAVGATVMFVHHLRKSANMARDKAVDADPDEEIRGSSAIAGFYDQHWALRGRNENAFGRESKINDLLLRSKDDEDKRFEVEWYIKKEGKTATFRMDETSEEVTLDKQMKECEMLLSAASEAIAKKRIEEMMNLDDASFLLRAMVEAGRLKIDGRGYVLAKAQVLE
jgi:hypothetical protein